MQLDESKELNNEKENIIINLKKEIDKKNKLLQDINFDKSKNIKELMKKKKKNKKNIKRKKTKKKEKKKIYYINKKNKKN